MMGAADRSVAVMSQLATIGRALVVLCCTAGLLLTFMGKEAHACDCDRPPVESGVQWADAVFVAEATEVRDPQQGQPGASMEVTEVHAGEIHEELFVETPDDTCAYEFETGRQELIYATEESGRFSAHMCSVIPLDEAGERLAALGEGSLPLPGVQEPDEPNEPEEAEEVEGRELEPDDDEPDVAQDDIQDEAADEETTRTVRNLALGSLVFIVLVVIGRRFAQRGRAG